MIVAVHTLVDSDDAPATRAFLRDVLGRPSVEDAGSGGGWLISDTGPGEMGVHPTRDEWEGQVYEHPRHHSIAWICDDIAATRTGLEATGASLVGEIRDDGFGSTSMLEVPGADPIMLYEPRHDTASDR